MVVDRIVAVVGERLVLASDVELEKSLGALERSSVGDMMGASADPLQVVIDRAIIRGLAGNAAIYTPSEDEILTRANQLRTSFADAGAWETFRRQHGLEGDRLTSLLYSRLVVDRYILRNVPQGATDGSYAAWINPQRARVTIRLVPPIADRSGTP